MKIEIPKPLITRKLTREERKTIKTPWLTGRGTRWMVVIDWWVCIDGEWFLVPTGYVFNGSSIPWFLWWLFPPTYDPAWEASAFHDYCYSHLWLLVSKNFADRAFRGIMITMGSSTWVSNVFYKAVSNFGKGGWEMLRIGDKGRDVEALQEALKAAGIQLSVDGQFGPATDQALRTFQKSQGIVADGIAGPKTMNSLGGETPSNILKQADLEAAAKALDVELAAVMAINEIESRGRGFLPDGRPVILFERHIMRRRLEHHGANVALWEAASPDVVNRSSGGYQGGEREWNRLGLAWSINPDAGIESASWGLFQIMGFHWERLGYESATDFMNAMRESEGKQLEAFVRFIKADPALHQALQRLQWPTVARLYNGPAFAKHAYDKRLAASYDRHSAAIESTV